MMKTFKIGKLGLLQVMGLLLVIGTAAAAITLTYTTTSNQTLGVKTAPIQFASGADGGVSDYVPSLSMSGNKTFYTATVKGVPEATVTIDDLVDLKNVDTRTHTVTLTAPVISNALVTAYKIDFYDATPSLVGSINFKAASPSVTFTNMAASSTYTGKLTITLASGAGANNVADALALTTTVSS